MPARAARIVVGVVLTAALWVPTRGVAQAVPPPPPNPSDSQLSGASAASTAQVGQVATLIAQLTSAQTQLKKVSDDVALRMELANKALVDLQTA